MMVMSAAHLSLSRWARPRRWMGLKAEAGKFSPGISDWRVWGRGAWRPPPQGTASSSTTWPGWMPGWQRQEEGWVAELSINFAACYVSIVQQCDLLSSGHFAVLCSLSTQVYLHETWVLCTALLFYRWSRLYGPLHQTERHSFNK